MEKRTQNTVFLGVLCAAALLLSYLESLFVLTPGIPGIKLGLANLAVVLCLYRRGWREALLLNLTRVVLASLLFSGMFTMLYSLCGAVFSFAAMLLGRRSGRLSVLGVSILGGVFHNLGQLAAAVIVLGGNWVLWYLPWLLAAGCVAGLFIGVSAGAVGKYLPGRAEEKENGAER
ncbi:MAG: Gx transporter family protein [Eubacteriales bacterium]|nr:Gx transporter family protein [Eubacteriales bacterium]